MSRQFSPLFLAGVLVLLVGAAGVLAHHASMPVGAVWFCSLLGQGQNGPAQSAAGVQGALGHLAGGDGTRAHLIVLAGMLITTADLVRCGLHRDGGQR